MSGLQFAQNRNENAIKIFGGLYFLSLTLWPEMIRRKS